MHVSANCIISNYYLNCMAYSVLSIDVNQGIYGLYDSIKESFIMTGSSPEMYKLKHEIEDAEQQDDNREYFKSLVAKYKKMLESVKLLENQKSNSVVKKIELFQRYLEEN